MEFCGRSETKNRTVKKDNNSQSGLDFIAKDQNLKTVTKEHRDSQATWHFTADDQRSGIELRKSTGTHILDEILWQEIKDQKQN